MAKAKEKKFEDKTVDEKTEELRIYLESKFVEQKCKEREKIITEAAHPLVKHFAASEDKEGLDLFKRFIETILEK